MNGNGLRWKPLPTGSFTGTRWNRPGEIDGQDPYLVWAEADAFAGYGHHHGSDPLKWLPIVIEIAPGADVAELVRASSHHWLQIPRAYLNLPGLRYCSARVSAHFFEALRQQPVLRALVVRYELGLPVGPHTHALHDPCTVAHANAAPLKGPRPAKTSRREKGLKGPVIGLIDGGLALVNQAFLNPRGPSRVQHFWRQDSCYQGPWPNQNTHGSGDTPLDPQRAGPTPADMGYGHELTASNIRSAMARFTPSGGSLDEAALYRHFQLWDLARPVNHGTHVMSLAAGSGIPHMPVDDAASRCDLVAVQLDWSNIQDTSGGAMNVSVLDGLMYIVSRCAPSAEVVINISWGTLAGPHDGSSILEAAMDQLIELLGKQLQITVPAGNGYQSRTHANDTLAPGTSCPLHWRVLPDDHTQSFLEIWLPDGADQVTIELTPPGASAPLPALRPGQAGIWKGNSNSQARHPLCALIYPQRSALGANGTCALIALAPTFGLEKHVATAPFGVWEVRLRNEGNEHVTFDAYIERDDVALGQHTGARQSYFEDARYDTSGNLGSFTDHANNPTPIRRSGTFNSLSTGQRTVSVGGTRRQADAWNRFARYSPQKPDPDATRPQRPGVKKVPDTLQPSDDNPALWGVLGAASLSGSMARLAGTSSSSPQQARDIINQRTLPGGGSSTAGSATSGPARA
ncbi:hypothetical protein LPB72_18995 [Hydrogenophaga crassostreae]|uniref:Peptidase S8/S53 domain-containing protein n=1 Tax=Hydrogenophaga crassostreae TaxID=1763535 RepID=A0A162YUE8_9BURK|nr:hypothetical protein [Hydrogenophaga crassostreae]AOW13048.1 hypothetical protein LPB072_09500 [Hydrogenophaga crassostreae]OAD40232.1 hypothetical protein LPB72_18995 [Hydrogenophaga crassostreae]